MEGALPGPPTSDLWPGQGRELRHVIRRQMLSSAPFRPVQAPGEIDLLNRFIRCTVQQMTVMRVATQQWSPAPARCGGRHDRHFRDTRFHRSQDAGLGKPAAL